MNYSSGNQQAERETDYFQNCSVQEIAFLGIRWREFQLRNLSGVK